MRKNFIAPQLTQLFNEILASKPYIRVLEIEKTGRHSAVDDLPGALRPIIRFKSALDDLPDGIRVRIRKDTLPWMGLEDSNGTHPTQEHMEVGSKKIPKPSIEGDHGEYDVILFCHSLDGFSPKSYAIKKASLRLAHSGKVVVFDRAGKFFNGLICERTTTDSTANLWVPDISLDDTTPFIAGVEGEIKEGYKALRHHWSQVCRALGGWGSLYGFKYPGAQPSVGAGSWLQGGIGPLSRVHGLACDSITGAVIVSLQSGELMCVGKVPSRQRPAEWDPPAIRPPNEDEILWTLAGAGTNIGIVVAVVFKTYPAREYLMERWKITLDTDDEANHQLKIYDGMAESLPAESTSADMYLFRESGQLHLNGGTTTSWPVNKASQALPIRRYSTKSWGSPENRDICDHIGLFKRQTYLSEMHESRGKAQVSSFKRCVSLGSLEQESIRKPILEAMKSPPSPLCYLHLVQGGGAVRKLHPTATAFGCRKWEHACVITGVWPREENGTKLEVSVIAWVYKLATDLLAAAGSRGAYAADLGPDPRDAVLAANAVGPNLPCLVRLKEQLDPQNTLAYACPLLKSVPTPRLVVAVTCGSRVDLEDCIKEWRRVLAEYEEDRHPRFLVPTCNHPHSFKQTCIETRINNISENTRREYAEAKKADLIFLDRNRRHEEEPRPGALKFYREQVNGQPDFAQMHFQRLMSTIGNIDILLLTGLKGNSFVDKYSHLVPNSKLVSVHIKDATDPWDGVSGYRIGANIAENVFNTPTGSKAKVSMSFEDFNDSRRRCFAKMYLIPLFASTLRLRQDIQVMSEFQSKVEFRHIRNIGRYTSLLKRHLGIHGVGGFKDTVTKVDIVVGCEIGGRKFAARLANAVEKPLVLIREVKGHPPPVPRISTEKITSRPSSRPPPPPPQPSSSSSSSDSAYSSLHSEDSAEQGPNEQEPKTYFKSQQVNSNRVRPSSS
ncbi:hypothetical protein M011DRAFT_490261 [Sporormia fimetaria CBS 119925]|uniref:FAD-binding PCMH-type domain-containing protein n=1 Tax=Sporormia fimetaria CBS 119925 TaxID=1340428 RepID=A0A6A6UZF2_9PLEO|nr:hypothetical protein M011DRAFT_490261 [Sporormia fimetaria CBS 119925]